MNNSFPKAEHLFGLNPINNLHSHGDAFISYPFRIVFRLVDDEIEKMPIRVMVSVPKKRFKRAVARNRIKRLTREAYRLNKSILMTYAIENNKRYHLSFQYISNDILSFDEMNEKMQKALNKLIQKIEITPNNADKNN